MVIICNSGKSKSAAIRDKKCALKEAQQDADTSTPSASLSTPPRTNEIENEVHQTRKKTMARSGQSCCRRARTVSLQNLGLIKQCFSFCIFCLASFLRFFMALVGLSFRFACDISLDLIHLLHFL